MMKYQAFASRQCRRSVNTSVIRKSAMEHILQRIHTDDQRFKAVASRVKANTRSFQYKIFKVDIFDLQLMAICL